MQEVKLGRLLNVESEQSESPRPGAQSLLCPGATFKDASFHLRQTPLRTRGHPAELRSPSRV